MKNTEVIEICAIKRSIHELSVSSKTRLVTVNISIGKCKSPKRTHFE